MEDPKGNAARKNPGIKDRGNESAKLNGAIYTPPEVAIYNGFSDKS